MGLYAVSAKQTTVLNLIYSVFLSNDSVQNPVMNIKLKITRFCNWPQALWYNFRVEVLRCRILILIKNGFFLLMQTSNQEMQKSQHFFINWGFYQN